MKIRKIFGMVLLVVVILLFVLTTVGIAEINGALSIKPADILMEDQAIKDRDVELRAELINATLNAISIEIERYQKREDTQKEEKISYLKKLLGVFQNMKPEEYVLKAQKRAVDLFDERFGVLMPPELREVEVVTPPTGIGSILEVVGMTRSGPFYHVVGIWGHSLEGFRIGVHYKLKIYLVYKREYWWMPDYYVYIAEWQPVGEKTNSTCYN